MKETLQTTGVGIIIIVVVVLLFPWIGAIGGTYVSWVWGLF